MNFDISRLEFSVYFKDVILKGKDEDKFDTYLLYDACLDNFNYWNILKNPGKLTVDDLCKASGESNYVSIDHFDSELFIHMGISLEELSDLIEENPETSPVSIVSEDLNLDDCLLELEVRLKSSCDEFENQYIKICEGYIPEAESVDVFDLNSFDFEPEIVMYLSGNIASRGYVKGVNSVLLFLKDNSVPFIFLADSSYIGNEEGTVGVVDGKGHSYKPDLPYFSTLEEFTYKYILNKMLP